ncbi:DUF952 domain-containing protein [Brucella pituitosa]|uniref:DUF952 domain-containing protein n=1 Tax=Brucella TaxID=234 RepID=UPI0004648243|nr:MULTISPECIES: DUF952 domain-containing protein [Brucella]PQZ49322.1 DUF952 domain-containing protein [Ochrobactrum sp. MYb19]PRA57458.1 DUF952 domain-containing protein [Ochrobactrum sp. MYb68]PRA66860.1 DUF952 domain-containing protein [Ochrobactrum sp. MYb18]PRA76110.1 DUF952 domain-containing protein [Brucella thiophenivorans]PRA89129.1 DUF952 domain-containing protein [Ochrobactrum sp. MYb29]PRA91870.1 DUF952 domain-containing protein [Ochrobactrum sp. MYb14]PRA98118.1 DUF952 domain-c
MTKTTIYKIAPRDLWAQAEEAGIFTGAPVDIADGYIHFSTYTQVRETAAKHFAGQTDLLLVSVDVTALGDALKYEASRGGALFPHLYATLPMSAVTKVEPLPLDKDGLHIFPELEDK